MTLVALFAMTTGAWADGKVYTSAVDITALQVGDILAEGASITGIGTIIFDLNRVKVNGTLQTEGFIYLYTSDFDSFGAEGVISLSNNSTISPVDKDNNDGNAWEVTNVENNNYIHIQGITYAPAPDGPEVTINEAKTEASFQMPAFDATADYELVRDMSIQMTAQVGDGTQEQPRYRVKKDGNKFIPADMEMAAVPALFTVNDAIEQKALTQTQDYIVQIYAIDAEGQPTGEAMTFATFTFEPGIYAVKAVAAQGSDYDGETPLSNTFKLFQGYEVQVAAKEFITYYKDEPLYADTETSADAELYTITSVSADQATLSAAIQTAPSLTPLLIFNNSDQAKTFLLIPANEEPNLALTVAPEFQGTLAGTTIAASTDAQTNYALNGKAFVFVTESASGTPSKRPSSTAP